jgi:hypothetical protein
MYPEGAKNINPNPIKIPKSSANILALLFTPEETVP